LYNILNRQQYYNDQQNLAINEKNNKNKNIRDDSIPIDSKLNKSDIQSNEILTNEKSKVKKNIRSKNKLINKSDPKKHSTTQKRKAELDSLINKYSDKTSIKQLDELCSEREKFTKENDKEQLEYGDANEMIKNCTNNISMLKNDQININEDTIKLAKLKINNR
jgi:myosin heavy subunit